MNSVLVVEVFSCAWGLSCALAYRVRRLCDFSCALLAIWIRRDLF
jgi:hypothetical protein